MASTLVRLKVQTSFSPAARHSSRTRRSAFWRALSWPVFCAAGGVVAGTLL